MNFSTFYFALILTAISSVFCCSPEEIDNQECYRCNYVNNVQTICDSILVYESCIIRPHENSLQMVMEITEKCNGQITNTSEEIGFVEDFLSFHQNAGANCEEF